MNRGRGWGSQDVSSVPHFATRAALPFSATIQISVLRCEGVPAKAVGFRLVGCWHRLSSENIIAVADGVEMVGIYTVADRARVMNILVRRHFALMNQE